MTAQPVDTIETDDAELIRRSHDDPEQFAVLFDRYLHQIHRYVARRLGTQVADDIAAETFLVAFRRRGSYDLARTLARPWLYGIATTLIARHRRDEERFLRALSRTGVDPLPEPMADAVLSRVAAQEDEGRPRRRRPAPRGEVMDEVKRFRGSTPVITREAEESARAALVREMRAVRAPARRRLVWRVALAGALAVAIGVGVVGWRAPAMTPVASVQELGERAAEAAEAAGSMSPSPGQWLYVKEKQAAPDGTFGVDLGRRTTSEMWTSVDGKQTAWYRPGGDLLVQGTHPGISAADLARPPVTPEGVLDLIDRVTAEHMAQLIAADDSTVEESREQQLFQAVYQLMGRAGAQPRGACRPVPRTAADRGSGRTAGQRGRRRPPRCGLHLHRRLGALRAHPEP